MPSAAKMFTPAQIAVAALIGSPLPGFYLLAKNCSTAGEKKNARFILIIGIIVTTLLIVLAFHLPAHSPHSFLPIASTVGVHQIAKLTQAKIRPLHLAGGGRLASWWTPVGYGVLGLLLVIAVLLGISLALPE